MKKKIRLLPATALFFLISSCTRDNISSTDQTNTKIQYKWTLISSTLVFPTDTQLNSTYTGVSTDFYLFDKDDSLTVQQAGNVNLLTQPVSYKLKYSVQNSNTLIYGPGSPSSIQIKILTLNDTLLVISNAASASFINADNSVTVYDGTKTDSLKR